VNDILIPSDKHLLCEQMRRADGFSWVGPINLGEQREGSLQGEVLRAGWLSSAGAHYAPTDRSGQRKSNTEKATKSE